MPLPLSAALAQPGGDVGGDSPLRGKGAARRARPGRPRALVSTVLTTRLPTETLLPGADRASAGRRQVVSAVGKPADQRPGHCSAQERRPGQGHRTRRPDRVPPGEKDPQQPAAPRPSPLHPLHQVGHQLVRDAGAGLLSQAEGVLQLLQSPHTPAALPVLLFELRGHPRHLTGGQGGCLPAPPDLRLAAEGSAAPGSP